MYKRQVPNVVVPSGVMLNVEVPSVVVLNVVVPSVVVPFAISLQRNGISAAFAYGECRVSYYKYADREIEQKKKKIQKQFCLSVLCPSFFTLSQMHYLKMHQKQSLYLSVYNTGHWLT